MAHSIIPTSSTRLFPDEPSSACTVPLSILDASVGNFAPAAAAWVYDVPPAEGKSALTPALLKLSLIKTLNAYPQWAGQLQYTQYNPKGGHTSRSRRCKVTYGIPADPGVEFVVADSSTDIASLFPSVEERTSGAGAFDASSLGELELLPKSPDLASHSSADFTGLPCLIVQVTNFKCGGSVIALKSSHPLADAQTLTTFINDWAAVNRALFYNLPLSLLSPIFLPAALDGAASGDIDAASPDPEIVKIAHELPIHRYDWWTPVEGCPAPEAATIPPHLASLTDIELGPPIPWHEWDLTAPVSNFLLYFSADELARIWAAAVSPGHTISRFDALQAHVWAVLMLAQGKSPEEEFHMNLSLGMRDRVVPPLGARALGSPIVLARASGTTGMSLAELARAIRAVVVSFTPVRVAAVLHEMAFDVDSRRMWGGFIGWRNTIVTSWMRLGVYEVDFGGGRPRFVQAVMPAMAGVIQVMEAMPQSSSGGPWYQDGASVSLMLSTDVIQRMLKDPLLRKYRGQSS
ncbi:transferase family-domain-containing protein [Mycena maculata]|uniref:Transferase family-domain-containing protein n=1 Tax=Mycena maculata TaxID=230809 RepID=A0AAD7JSJ4_9AGAR|nr:transferase family-domain-containing protein [Mycena maculata]